MRPARLSPAQAILYGTLVVGTLDIVDAFAFFGLRSGATPVRSSPEMFGKQISADFSQWKKVILESRLRLEA